MRGPNEHLLFRSGERRQGGLDVVPHPLATLVGRQGVRHVHDIGGQLAVVVGLQVVNVQVRQPGVLVLIRSEDVAGGVLLDADKGAGVAPLRVYGLVDRAASGQEGPFRGCLSVGAVQCNGLPQVQRGGLYQVVRVGRGRVGVAVHGVHQVGQGGGVVRRGGVHGVGGPVGATLRGVQTLPKTLVNLADHVRAASGGTVVAANLAGGVPQAAGRRQVRASDGDIGGRARRLHEVVGGDGGAVVPMVVSSIHFFHGVFLSGLTAFSSLWGRGVPHGYGSMGPVPCQALFPART